MTDRSNSLRCTTPGGALLAAPILPALTGNGLTANELAAVGNELLVRVPGYFGMQAGDTLQSYWGQRCGPSHHVQPQEVGSDQVGFRVDRRFLEELGNGTVDVRYTVQDRHGNRSAHSQAAALTLHFDRLPANLGAPVALQIGNGQVHDRDARLGIKIAIPHYDNMAIGDEINVYWGNEKVPPCRRITRADLQRPLPIKAVANYPQIARHGDGPATLTYSVSRNGVSVTSAALALEVFLQLPGPQDPTPQTLVNEALAAPLIKGKSSHSQGLDNYLDEQDAQQCAEVLIAWRRGLRVGDRVHLHWGRLADPLTYAVTLQDVQNASYLRLKVPHERILAQGCGVQILVSYSLTREGNPNTSYSPVQPVSVVFQTQLPGGSAGLSEPVFTGANVLNAVDPRKDPHGTTVYVPPYRNMQVDDRVLLHFCGFDALTGGANVEPANHSVERRVTADDLRNGCRFKVPLAKLMAVGQGRGRARYDVINALGRASSLPADVYISSNARVTPH